MLPDTTGAVPVGVPPAEVTVTSKVTVCSEPTTACGCGSRRVVVVAAGLGTTMTVGGRTATATCAAPEP